MKKKFNINYICEVNYPNSSAYSIHVMKMCDAFREINFNTKLYVPFFSGKTKKLEIDYNLKNKINIKKIFKKRTKFNFLLRIYYSFNILKNTQGNETLYISRSTIFAILATLINKNIILELHHPMSGLTKIIFDFFNFLGFLKKLKFIFIHKNLTGIFKIKKNNYLCLDDAIDLFDFQVSKKSDFKKNTCVYVGSFHEGKGIEIIEKISKKLPKINFHLYGDKSFLKKKIFNKNVKFYDFVKYNKVPSILNTYHVALMPYGNKVIGRMQNINLVNYMSPLKMFDYLASQNIIIASKLKVYDHILKHKKNSIIIENEKDWENWIELIFKSPKKFSYIKKNAFKTAKKFTWKNRATKIVNFYNKFI